MTFVLANTDQGVWAKYIGGKSKITDGADARMTYNGVQVGYDHKASNGWIFGGALDYSTSSNSYAVGSGDDKSVALRYMAQNNMMMVVI